MITEKEIAFLRYWERNRMQYKWEMNEQLYQELKLKENRLNKINNQTDIH